MTTTAALEAIASPSGSIRVLRTGGRPLSGNEAEFDETLRSAVSFDQRNQSFCSAVDVADGGQLPTLGLRDDAGRHQTVHQAGQRLLVDDADRRLDQLVLHGRHRHSQKQPKTCGKQSTRSPPIGWTVQNAAPFNFKTSADILCVIRGDLAFKPWPKYSTLC